MEEIIQKKRSYALKRVGNYTLGKTIGKGSMGKVKVAIFGNKQYACKIVKRPIPNKQMLGDICSYDENGLVRFEYMCDFEQGLGSSEEMDDRRLVREMALTLLLDHPYIVTVHEVFVSEYFYYIIMDFVNGTHVLDFIISHGKLKERFAQNLFSQLISAVEYCHKNSIVHRDLKIENILINEKGYMQLIDFGLANLYSPTSYLNTFCGSLYFAAPELLSAKKYIGPEVDIWSLGVILYVLTCGRVPFDDANLPQLHAKIIAGHVEYPHFLSANLRSLLSRMLVVNPANRATLEEIKNHGWLNKVDRIVNYLPQRAPITMPLDPKVVANMGGFNFGSKEEIMEKLLLICQSAESQLTMHPIVNIYRLVQEKMARSGFAYNEKEPVTVVQERMNSREHSIQYDNAAPPLRRTKSWETSISKYKKKRQSFLLFKRNHSRKERNAVSGNDQDTSVNETAANLFASIKTQMGKVPFLTVNPKEEVKKQEDSSANRGLKSLTKGKLAEKSFSEPVIAAGRGFSKVFSNLFSTRKSGKGDVQQQEKPEEIGATNNTIPSVIVAEPPPIKIVPRVQNSSPISFSADQSKFTKMTLASPERAMLGTKLRNSYRKTEELEGTSAGGPCFNNDVNLNGQIDDYIEKVNFTKLFSVSTTSTKPPSKIRPLIFRALSQLSSNDYIIDILERRGAIVVNLAVKQSLDTIDDVFRLSTDSAESRPSVSFSNATDLEEFTTEGDPDVMAKVRSSKLSIEIRICKIKMMRMWCIRFRRLRGDTIRYREACTKIIDNLGW